MMGCVWWRVMARCGVVWCGVVWCGEGDEGVRTTVPYLRCSARRAAVVLEMETALVAVLETALVADCLASGTPHAPTVGLCLWLRLCLRLCLCLVCTTLLSR